MFDPIYPLIDILTVVIDVITNLIIFVKPLLSMVWDYLAPFGEMISLVFYDISLFLANIVVFVLELSKLLSPILYAIEAILKAVETVAIVINGILSFDFSNIGNKIENIWTNWDTNDFLNTKFSLPSFATGASNIDSGTVFRAGEMGKTEVVYNAPNGKTNVANVQQIKAAELQALREWWASARNDLPQFREANPTGLYQVVTGVAKSYGNKWDQY
jgi:hypothetical protein